MNGVVLREIERSYEGGSLWRGGRRIEGEEGITYLRELEGVLWQAERGVVWERDPYGR